MPLTKLTRKGQPFVWTNECHDAFERLKELFTTAPILMQFDPDRETVVEADSSGWATGGALSQIDDQGLLRPCAFFSRKNTPAECNYDIHDKELLAIINCLKTWEAELMSVSQFSIITDHKNLRYFMSMRRLNERQMRWSDILSQFNFQMTYRPGKQAIVPDALSRREQDIPRDDDARLRNREKQLFGERSFVECADGGGGMAQVAPIRIATGGSSPRFPAPLTDAPELHAAPISAQHDDAPDFEGLWQQSAAHDDKFPSITTAIRDGNTRFPKELQLSVSISECELDNRGQPLFRGRRWVPDYEPLRTRIMQEIHDSKLSGHPGHNALYGLISRAYFWPNMSSDIRRFVRNCDRCGANRVWRDRRQGLLKPLPIPERKWRDISLNFIEKLPFLRAALTF